MEDIIDADYKHVKRVCKDFEIKKFGENHENHDLKSVTLLLVVFENFRKMRLEIYRFDPARFVLAPGLAW